MTTIKFSPSANKDLQSLPRSQKNKIKRKLSLLETNPYAGKKLSAELEGFFSLRAWPYRIIYEILNKKEIGIVRIQHRKDVYKRI